MVINKTAKDKVIEKSNFWRFDYEAEDAQFVDCEVFTDGTEKDENNNMYSKGKGFHLKNFDSYLAFNIEVPWDGT